MKRADRFARKIVLHAGSNEGVRAGSPVIDDIGVVGQVTRVFRDTSEVTLLTDKDQTIPVQIVRNGLRGVAYGGAEPGTLDLRFMASNADLVKDDIAVTSGLGRRLSARARRGASRADGAPRPPTSSAAW